MTALDPGTWARGRGVWAALAGADVFPESGARVVVNAESQICPPDWCGVVALGDGVLATTPDEARRGRLVEQCNDLGPADDWAIAFADVAEVRGPARLAYIDLRVFPDEDEPPFTEVLRVGDDAVAAFVAGVPAADRDEAGLEGCTSPLACVRHDGAIVAAAGYRIWREELAHMSVLVAPDHRGAGLATTVARDMTRSALEHGLIPQWRARPAASQAVARKIGYVDVGQQISIKLP
ncbi:MAG TPA: GNAT family N-acetyltransferase [Acidimicrobiia bacterium]|nr:GNAT family N-acetyltransferase [Acidimicrobiia bacterium]